MSEENYLELIKLIQKSNYEYYTMDTPFLTDAEYDELYDRLIDYEKENPDKISPNSPTMQVGGKLKEGLQSKKHTVRLYSLDKVKAGEEQDIQTKLLDKIDNSEILVEWKYDGLTVVLRYEDGYLVEGRSRGDGFSGEVISNSVRNILSIPEKIPYKKTLEVQGEIIVTRSGLKKYNDRQLAKIDRELLSIKRESDKTKIINKYPLLKNPRNAAAGSVRQLDMAIVKSRPLDAFLYNVLLSDEQFNKQSEILEFLRENGFKVNSDNKVVKGLNELKALIVEMDEKRDALDFEVDGLTIKANYLKYKTLGHTEKFPRYSLAYKFQPLEFKSELLKVEWLVGRTGVITPRAVIRPVEINGTIVSRATLNNYEMIRQKNLQLNEQVYVRKTGEVIPEIIGPVDTLAVGVEIVKPTKCPVCKTKSEYQKPFLMCVNPNCEAKTLKKWDHFLSKPGLNIKGLAIKNIERFITAGYLVNFSDIYRLTYEQILTIEGYEKVSAEKLLKEIEDKKTQTLSAFIYALGIPEVGIVTAQKLEQHYKDWAKFERTTLSELKTIDDIGEKVSENIMSWLNSKENVEEAHKIMGYIRFYQKPINTEGKLKGRKYVITGKFEKAKRSDIKSKLETLGATVLDKVTKETDCLIAGEDAGSKLSKAQQLNIRIIGFEGYEEEVAIE